MYTVYFKTTIYSLDAIFDRTTGMVNGPDKYNNPARAPPGLFLYLRPPVGEGGGGFVCLSVSEPTYISVHIRKCVNLR